jgi:hypothetical protein
VSTDRTIRKVTDTSKQELDTFRYWQSQPIGDRLTAVWDVSEAAYAFAAAFKGVPPNDDRGPERTITRIQRASR